MRSIILNVTFNLVSFSLLICSPKREIRESLQQNWILSTFEWFSNTTCSQDVLNWDIFTKILHDRVFPNVLDNKHMIDFSINQYKIIYRIYSI